MLLWVVAVLALVLAGAALLLVRWQGRRIDSLSQSYWELRYDYTRLRSQVTRIDPGETAGAADVPAPAPAAVPTPTVSYVPLSSMRKKDQ